MSTEPMPCLESRPTRLPEPPSEGPLEPCPSRALPGLLSTVLVALAALASARAVAAEPIRGSFDSDGVEIHYQVEGDGAPVLLVHGYTATGDVNWRFPGMVAALEGYRIILVDNRGHGRSDKPLSPDAYGPHMVDDAVRLLDHLGIERAHVVGYSMGGTIALQMLTRHPDRLLSAQVTGMGWTRADEETRRRYREGEPRTEDPALAACWRAFGDLGVTRKSLEAIEVPFQVVVGSEDPLYERSVQPLLEVRPDVPLVVVEGATHSTCLFKKEFHQAVRRFLDETSRTTSPARTGR